MKNLHLLKTDKPSRNNDFTNQNIYITSDEEIKEGDWFTDDNNSLKRSYKLSHVQFANPKKIILTTDQDLIKDGVQAIDDEFLEWFVKNPSCEEIKIIDEIIEDTSKDYIVGLGQPCTTVYKIIIPQEEFKQETLEEVKDLKRNKMKQTAVEFLANELVKKGFPIEKYAIDLFEQAKELEKEQQGYSEEEVLDLLRNFYYSFDPIKNPSHTNTIPLWFEQFKKK